MPILSILMQETLSRLEITVRNVGHYGAYDIHIDDDLPTGFEIPAGGLLNLSVTDGSGTDLVYSGDLFGTGLTITNSLAGDDATDQFDNILIITYDLFFPGYCRAITANGKYCRAHPLCSSCRGPKFHS